MEKIDVCINVLGKPYQTLVSLKTLLDYCGKNIDKIFVIEEKKQPKAYSFDVIKNNLNYENIVKYNPQHHLWVDGTDLEKVKKDEDYRLSLRYQYGIEKTDKKHILLIHNDIIFTDNIVEKMLSIADDCFCVGKIGQCWNCPLFYEKICSGEVLSDRIKKNNLGYKEIMQSIEKYPKTRTFKAKNKVSKTKPFPMPECRVNEWCALINANIYRKETIPNGDVFPFGGYFGIDIGDIWFRQMVDKKYKFKNFENGEVVHAFFSTDYSGHSSLFDEKKYLKEESNAKIYFERFLKTNDCRFI